MTAERIKRAPAASQEVLQFWFKEAGRRKWFRGGASFDEEIRRRFGDHHAAASAGALESWRATQDGALALLLILDQFSRNMFRGKARAFASDAKARAIAYEAITRRFDKISPPVARQFFYLPFMHSENLADQDRSVALFTALLPASDNLPYAIEHRRVIEEFGRFPYRNEALGRVSTPAEMGYLRQRGNRR